LSGSAVPSDQQETEHGGKTRRSRSGDPPASAPLLPLRSARLTVCVTVDKLNNLKQKDRLLISKPKVSTVTAKPTKLERRQTSTLAPTTAGTKTRAKVPTRKLSLKPPLLFLQPVARNPGKTRSSSNRSRPPTSTLWGRSDT
ncbi:unnamed protein product, partial [Tetraodon nigroviridis]